VESRHFRRSRSWDRLTIITLRRVESDPAGSTVGSRRDTVWEPPSSQLEVPEPVLYNWQHGLKSVDESLDSNDETSEGMDHQSEESEESEETENNELGQHGDNRDHALAWGA